MDKKKLLVSLMKLDKAYTDKVIKLNEVLGEGCELFEAELFTRIDDEGKEVKCICDIVLEYAGIPEDDYDELENPEGFCRDGISDLYSSVVMPSTSLFKVEGVTFEIVAESLIGLGELMSEEGTDWPKWDKVAIKKYNELMMMKG